jgi:hypothetical protein
MNLKRPLFVCGLVFVAACQGRGREPMSEGVSLTRAALTGGTSTAAPSSCAVTLTAAMVFHGSVRTDGAAHLVQLLPFRVPSSIPVSAGSTKNGKAQLSFSRSTSASTITCSYALHGGGTSFVWTGCDDGDVVGSPESADTFVLHIESADHGAGTTDTSIQLVTTIAAVDGTGCDDGNACTHTDTCQLGTCVGTDPTSCTALDECHLPGICDPATGICSNPEQDACTLCEQLSNCAISPTGVPHFFATDPTITGAALEFPPTQTLTLQISPQDEIAVGMSFPHDDASWPDGASAYQLTTLGKVVSFNNALPTPVSFGDQCATMTLPFDADGMFPVASPSDTVRIYQLLDGVLLNVPGPQTVDLTNGLVSACVHHLSDYVVVQESPARGFYEVSAIWPQPSVSVCWEVLDTANVTERGWVRDRIEQTWEKNSRMVFTGWDQCTAASTGIRIGVGDPPLTAAQIAAGDNNGNAPHTSALGQHLDGMQNGMVLNFTFKNWGTSCQTTPEFCIRAIAAHEFGHALGFDHEQNRPDTPSTCTQDKSIQGDGIYGNWDSESVMNYCNPTWNGNGNLSPTDIDMVRALYGAPPGTDLLFSQLISALPPITNSNGEQTFGDTCPANYTRQECVVTAQSAGGSCYVLGFANPGDPNDCRCTVHWGWNNTQGPDFTCVAEVRGRAVAPTCGTFLLPCCNGICDSGLVCDGTNCVPTLPACGAPSEPCCKGASPCAGGLVCSSKRCLPNPTCAPGDVRELLNEYRSHYTPSTGARGNDLFSFDVPPGYTLDGVSLNKLPGTLFGDEFFNDPVPPAGSTGSQFFSVHWWFNLLGKAQYSVTATATCQTCPGSQTRCSGECTDTNSDAQNCGDCGNVCNGDCISGVCCQPGQTTCGGVCTDTRSDSLNCGACGNVCDATAGQFCTSSSCQCPLFETVCGGQCRDLRYDSANCGACFNACPSGAVCGGGSCQTPACGGRVSLGTMTDTNGNSFRTTFDTNTHFTFTYGWYDNGGQGIDLPTANSYCQSLGSGWTVPNLVDLDLLSGIQTCAFQMPPHLAPGSFYSAVDFWTISLGNNPGEVQILDPYSFQLPVKTQNTFSGLGSTMGVRCVLY